MTRPADIKDAVRYFTQTIFTKLIQENAQLLKGRTYRQIYRIGIGDLSEVLPCRLKRNVQRPYCSWEITVFKMGCFGRQEPIAPGHQLEEQSERGQRFFIFVDSTDGRGVPIILDLLTMHCSFLRV